MKNIRLKEFKLLSYRLFLVFLFYTITRILFIIYNYTYLQIDGIYNVLQLCFYGLTFDAAAISYVNILFIFLSILPFYINTKKYYQRFLMFVYFITNSIAISFNFIDFAYFKFNTNRTTLSSLEAVQNESNLTELFTHFLIDYWHVFLLFFSTIYFWIKLYNKRKIGFIKPKLAPYFGSTVFYLLLLTIGIIYSIRGDLKFSTRPITLVDANKYTSNSVQSSAILNTPFAFIRTFNKKAIKKVSYFKESEINKYIKTNRQYKKESTDFNKPNIVLFIVESFSREFIGAFNNHKNIDNYVSYTPFMDSLAKESLIFPNSYANGTKSIHGMASILAGIPSFTDAFTSSPYVNQPIESLVSIVKKEKYSTHFFHGAANGSMGFSGFANILGFDNYYGKTEYNNDTDYDGIWGIWDEPFFQYKKQVLDTIKQPFLSTIFTISSHDPYKVPLKYKNKFKEGKIPLHKCIRYTDFAIKQFMKKAKTSNWYTNTIFVFTADHTNQVYHGKEYYKALNRFSVPILFYSPNKSILKGINYTPAQHMDIYPTLVDLIGYDKPFRSWGRSLVKNEEPTILTGSNRLYYYTDTNSIFVFDGEKEIGTYPVDDLGLKNPIQQKTDKNILSQQKCKALIQSYNNKIVTRDLK